MKGITLVRFMTKEEFVDFITQIKNFRHPVLHRWHHGFKSCEASWSDPYNRAKYRFNMKNLDYADVLIVGEGYVRYHGASEEVLEMLKVKYGFEEE